MIATVLQENITKALVRIGRIISPRPQLPIVQNVLLLAKDGRLMIAGTNLETTEVVWVGARIEKDGGLCVPARTLTELLLTLPPESVRLSVKENSLLVQSEGVRAALPGISAAEFPPVPEALAKKGLSLDKESFLSSLGLVLFAAATDEGRPTLTGVRLSTEGGKTQITATDGYRLSVKTVSLGAAGPLDMIVPARPLGEVVKIGQEEKAATEVFLGRQKDANQLTCVVGDTEVSTRLIDGEYPNVSAIIPTSHTTRMLVEKESFLRAVKSAAVFSRDNANIVRLSLSGQKLTVSASSSQAGENEVEVAAKIDGDGGEIAFNSRFLLELFSVFPENELLFEMTGSLNPGVFKPVKDDSFFHIIMPVRVQAENSA